MPNSSGGARYVVGRDRRRADDLPVHRAVVLESSASEVEAQQGVLSASDNDTTIGLYLGAGIDFDVSESVFVGLGVRQTFGHDPTFAGLEADGDFTQVLVRVGGAF
ncbi:MAG: hypothetical protein H6828_02015 [Planctomycetes bacterium]|nr:hypothetical protein [Planctomycetota bacterium]